MPQSLKRISIAAASILAVILGVPAGSAWAARVAKGDLSIDPARVRAIAAMLPPHPAGLGRPITDRDAWNEIAARPAFKTAVQEAEKLLAKPLPQTSDELFLEFSRTGNRTHWEALNFQRRGRLSTLVLAECLEAKGRFIPAISELIRSLSAERTWLMPAHDRSLDNYSGKTMDIDLGSSGLGWALATADRLLGDRLDAESRELIRAQVGRRIIEPFKAMATGRRQANWWVTCNNNWNAVCLAGVTGAALALVEPREERAFFVAAAEKYSKNFLSGFTPDGYCSEGVGYWNYGFGHYLMLAETILQATHGGVDLLVGDKARQAALYGVRIQIVPDLCPAFADCGITARPSTSCMWYISRRWDLGLRKYDDAVPAAPNGSLFDVALWAFPNSASQTQPAPASPEALGQRSWFDKAGILIARPGDHRGCLLSAALKGGHNAESHNHNDVGSYVVVVDGKLVLADPGAEVYTARTFSDRRYESNVLNSFGHPVPKVAGKLQRPGADARGCVVRTEFTDQADTLVLDIRSAYDEPTLEKLERTFTYSREGTGTLTIADDIVFKHPQAFETAMITFGRWKQLAPDRLRIEDNGAAVEVVIRATGGEIKLQADQIKEDLRNRPDPTRIGISFAKPLTKGGITLTITPARHP